MDYRKITATIIILSTVLGLIYGSTILTSSDQGVFEGVNADPGSINNVSFSGLPFLSVATCGDKGFDNCISDYNEYESVKSQALLRTDSLTYLDKNSERYLVSSSEKINYECVGSEAYLRERTDTPDIGWSNDGVNNNYEQIDLNGVINFGETGDLDALQIVCMDYNQDEQGFWSGASVWSYWSKDIVVNKPPVIDSLNEESTVSEGKQFTVTVDANDANSGQSLDIEWNNGDTGSEASYVFNEPGTKTVSVTVSDGFDSVKDSFLVDVISTNSPPSIDEISVSPVNPEPGQQVNLSVEAVDSDGDDLTVSWSTGGSGESTSTVFDSRGLKTVSVTVSDQETSTVEEVKVRVGEKPLLQRIIDFFKGLI